MRDDERSAEQVDGVEAARREHAEVDAALVARARADDPDAFATLYERWFDRVHDLAFRITRDPGDAADVAQETFLSAWRQLGGLERPESFGGWLLRITRNTALNRRKKERRSSPRDSEGMAMIESDGPRAGAPVGFCVEDRAGALTDPARVAEDGEVIALVWESAEALGSNDAEVLDLTLRHGMTPAEIGDVIGVNRNAANQAVHRVRKRLRAAVEARVLWRSGEPACGDLADALADAGVTRFDRDAVRVTTQHAEACDVCARRRQLKLEPTALFAATPFLAVPLVKARVAQALAAEGVPLGSLEQVPLTTALDARSGRQWRRVGRIAAGVGTVVVVLVATVVLAERTDEVALRAERTAPSTATSVSTTTAPPAPTPTAAIEVPATQAPRVVTPPPAPEPPPPPPPAPAVVTGDLSISPSGTAPTIFVRPTLTWSTANAASVEVTGPGFASASASGSASVCPGVPIGPDCDAPPGAYTYRLRATDASGAVVLERTATFTVG